jgi:hypothetical protein
VKGNEIMITVARGLCWDFWGKSRLFERSSASQAWIKKRKTSQKGGSRPQKSQIDWKSCADKYSPPEPQHKWKLSVKEQKHG